MAKAQLHELLAVEPTLKKKAQAFTVEAIKTFTKKQSHFEGQIRRFHKKDDDGPEFPNEDVMLVADVTEKLAFVGKHYSNFLDALVQKEETNTEAKASFTLDGKEHILSAQSLLSLETALNNFKPLLTVIPTLTPGEAWETSPGLTEYRGNIKETLKMKKIQEPLIMSPATREHPAQVQLVSKDIPIGSWHTQRLSTALSVEDKSDMIERIDNLIGTVKQARMRANKQEVSKVKIGDQLIKHILGS